MRTLNIAVVSTYVIIWVGIAGLYFQLDNHLDNISSAVSEYKNRIQGYELKCQLNGNDSFSSKSDIQPMLYGNSWTLDGGAYTQRSGEVCRAYVYVTESK